MTASLVFIVAMMAAQEPGQDTHDGWKTKERRMLSEILQKPVYQRWKLRQEREEVTREDSYLGKMAREALNDIWEGIKDFFRWLRSLFKRTGLHFPNAPQGAGDLAEALRMAAWAAFFLLAALGGWQLYKLWMVGGGGKRLARVLSREKLREALDGADALALDWRGWMDVAGGLEAEGDFRAMYRALYLSLLSGLSEKGLIEYRKNRTNWVYVNGFKGPEEQRRSFGQLTGLFDQVWYGLKPPGEISLEDVKARAGALLKMEKAA